MPGPAADPAPRRRNTRAEFLRNGATMTSSEGAGPPPRRRVVGCGSVDNADGELVCVAAAAAAAAAAPSRAAALLARLWSFHSFHGWIFGIFPRAGAPPASTARPAVRPEL